MSRGIRVCYLLAHWLSHRRAGLAYRDCLTRLGVELVEEPGDADVVVIHNEPWSYAGYFRAFPELRDRHVVAYAVWETDVLPAHYRFALGLVDELWTCSSYCAAVLRDAARSLAIVPHVVEEPVRDERAVSQLRERIGGREDRFYFYTITSANPRKAVADAVRAFAGLFSPDEACFLIKSTAPLPPELAKVPGVVPLVGMATDAEIAALHHLGHCFVSAHRSEGWGLGLSEAMACGNLVVATGHGGNLDFMDEGNSLLVTHSVEPVHEKELRAQRFLTPEMRWAYVDVADLREKLRLSRASWPELQPVRDRAHAAMARFTPEAVAQVLGQRLANLQNLY